MSERNLDRIPPIATKFAYDFEGQAIAVSQAQKEGRLKADKVSLIGMDIWEELGHQWYKLSYKGQAPSTVWSGDCNGHVIELLRHGDTITRVLTVSTTPAPFYGKKMHSVAILLVGDKIIYKSPGFDLDFYQNPPRLNSGAEEGS